MPGIVIGFFGGLQGPAYRTLESAGCTTPHESPVYDRHRVKGL
jgi:hypothetical protein